MCSTFHGLRTRHVAESRFRHYQDVRLPRASSLPGSIRAEFRTGRLSLGGLGSSEALLARAATVVSLVACAMPGQLAEHGGVLESAVGQARIDCDAAT